MNKESAFNFFMEGSSPTYIRSRLEAHFADAAYSLRSVPRRCTTVSQGREDLQDENRSEMPPIDNLDTKILIWLERESFMSARSLSKVFGMRYLTVLDRLYSSLGMKPDHLRCMPYQLINHLRAKRVKVSQGAHGA
jgi:hypothetical protein